MRRSRTVLCEELRAAYDRIHLSEFFAGKTAEDLSLVASGFFEQRGNLRVRLNTCAVAIDRGGKSVTTSGGETLPYDKLVMATGSYPFVPAVPGKEREDCFVYRTIENLEAMRECGARSRSGVVIGGGLLGLECAKALRDMRLETHVVEFSLRLMAVQVDEGGAKVLRRKIEDLGVQVHTQKNTVQIVDGEQVRHRLVFADGTHLDADMIVFSAGIRPRSQLYVVMEFIEGQTLAQWRRDTPKLDLDTVRGIIAQIARGLGAFHRLEMLHQDLRPENVMIDATGTVRIIDFGSTQVAGLMEMAATDGPGQLLARACVLLLGLRFGR